MAGSRQSTSNVSLTPHWQKFVRQKIKSGRYQSASEVVREGLRLIEERDRAREMELSSLRQAIDVGWKQAEKGERVPGGQVFDEIRRLSASRRGKTPA